MDWDIALTARNRPHLPLTTVLIDATASVSSMTLKSGDSALGIAQALLTLLHIQT